MRNHRNNEIINKILKPVTITLEDKINYIENFLANHQLEIKELEVKSGFTINIREELLGRAPFMNDEFLVQIGDMTRTIEELYINMINSKFPVFDLEQKELLILQLLDQLNPEIVQSKMVDDERTVEEYALDELAPNLIDTTTVIIAGQKYEITEVFDKIVKQQIDMMVKEKEEQEELEATKYSNRGVTEVLEITQDANGNIELPVIKKPKPPLEAEEKEHLVSAYTASLMVSEEEYNKSANWLMDYIRTITDEHNLSNAQKDFEEFKASLEGVNVSDYLKTKLSVLEELITKKRNNIIKVEGNKEFFGDAIVGKIRALETELKNNPEIDNYNRIIGQIVEMETVMETKGINDYQVKGELLRFKKDVFFRRMKEDFLTKNQSKDKERLKEQIDAYILQIKQQVNSVVGINNSAYVAGTKVRVTNAYAEVNAFVVNSYQAGLLTKEETLYYQQLMDEVVYELLREKEKTNTEAIPVVSTDEDLLFEEEVTVKTM